MASAKYGIVSAKNAYIYFIIQIMQSDNCEILTNYIDYRLEFASKGVALML